MLGFTGAYSVTVRDSESQAGNYGFRILDTASQPALVFNTSTSGSFVDPREHDVFRFSGQQGQEVLLRLDGWHTVQEMAVTSQALSAFGGTKTGLPG